MELNLELFSIGRLLHDIRKERHISLSDMCCGLCNVSMASRIENGERVPHRKLIEALFGRLGSQAPIGGTLMTKADFDRRNLEYKIKNHISQDNYDVKQLLDQYKARKDTFTPLERQFYQFWDSIYQHDKTGDSHTFLKSLEEAMKITVKDYKTPQLPKQKLLTNTELSILNNIAIELFNQDKHKEDGLNLFLFLKSYCLKNIVNTSSSKRKTLYDTILFNLANSYRRINDYQQELDIAEEGLPYCVETNQLFMFPYFLFLKGHGQIGLGNREEGIANIKHAYMMFELISKQDEIEYTSKILKEQFGVTITDYF